MGVRVDKLKEKVIQQNTTMEAVAQVLGIDRSTLYRKLQNGAKNLTVSEAHSIASYLHLNQQEQLQIFWGD